MQKDLVQREERAHQERDAAADSRHLSRLLFFELVAVAFAIRDQRAFRL